MDGTVSSFLPAKGYGFVRGDDGRDYFLHQADLDQADDTPIEGQRITFEETATPKGYRARRVKALDAVGPVLYLMPDTVVQTRESEIRGWETLQVSLWRVHGSSRESPDDAKALMLERVASLGATGAVLVRYYKTTGSEAGTGRGTHHYTIHNFSAHPVIVGRASTQGTRTKDQLPRLDLLVTEVKAGLVARTRAARNAGFSVAAVIMGLAAVPAMAFRDGGALIALGAGAVVAMIGFSVMSKDHDGWLQPP